MAYRGHGRKVSGGGYVPVSCEKSDEAFEWLVNYFSQCDQPTMIVMFGDHQPGIEDEFFDEAMGVESAKVPNEQKMRWYETPFVIWTNYDQPTEDMGRLGAIYLSSYVLKRANLSLTPYNEFLLQLSKSSRSSIISASGSRMKLTIAGRTWRAESTSGRNS